MKRDNLLAAILILLVMDVVILAGFHFNHVANHDSISRQEFSVVYHYPEGVPEHEHTEPPEFEIEWTPAVQDEATTATVPAFTFDDHQDTGIMERDSEVILVWEGEEVLRFDKEPPQDMEAARFQVGQRVRTGIDEGTVVEMHFCPAGSYWDAFWSYTIDFGNGKVFSSYTEEVVHAAEVATDD